MHVLKKNLSVLQITLNFSSICVKGRFVYQMKIKIMVRFLFQNLFIYILY